jgi:DNA (cytosine-5)-methyltransferase 1
MHFSPDCTHHSQARGGQPRDRAIRSLSWVGKRWAGTVRPRIISFENVKEVTKWGPLIAKRDKRTGRCIRLLKVRSYTKSGKVRYVVTQKIAVPGERVPLQEQYLIPDKRYEGRTWKRFVADFIAMGYSFETRLLKACDYGAGTSRERLFGVGRCDGEPIRWPAPTHGPGRAHPYVTAADCIDWSIPCPSIFDRTRPLAVATHRRIARGMQRYVLNSAEPFIAPNNTNNMPKPVSKPVPTITTRTGRNLLVSPSLVQCANASSSGITAANQPLNTVTAWPKGGSHALTTATLVQASHGEGSGATKRRGTGALDPKAPVGVICASSATFAVATATLVKFRGNSAGQSVTAPVPAITSGAGAARPAGAAHALGISVATMVQVGYGERPGQAPRALDLQKPLGVVVAGGGKHAVVEGKLATAFMAQAYGSGENGNPAPPRPADGPVSTITKSGSQQQQVMANMVTLRGSNVGAPITVPVRTLSAQGEHHALVEYTLSESDYWGALRVGRFLAEHLELGELPDYELIALVTVHVKGVPHIIVDIGLRMLRREELFAAQGFPKSYVIDRTADGRAISISRSVAAVGNSVSPPPLFAIAAANLDKVPDLKFAEAA